MHLLRTGGSTERAFTRARGCVRASFATRFCDIHILVVARLNCARGDSIYADSCTRLHSDLFGRLLRRGARDSISDEDRKFGTRQRTPWIWTGTSDARGLRDFAIFLLKGGGGGSSYELHIHSRDSELSGTLRERRNHFQRLVVFLFLWFYFLFWTASFPDSNRSNFG